MSHNGIPDRPHDKKRFEQDRAGSTPARKPVAPATPEADCVGQSASNFSRNCERLLAERGVTREWLDAKGHLPEVALARGYYRHSKDSKTDLERFQTEYQSLPQRWQKAFMTKLGKQQDGLMRPHHPPPGMEADLRRLHLGNPHIYTQFRPDDAVKTGAWEDHEPHWAVRHWRHHLVRHEDHGNKREMTDAEVDALTNGEIAAIAATGKLSWRARHRHIDTGRFINVPSPKRDREWTHDHATAFRDKPKMLASHLKKHHPEGDVIGPHPHSGRVKDSRYEYAKRIDVNPLGTEEMLRQAEVLVFVIEGAQKADTALAEVLRNGGKICGRSAAVFSCPAVGQWGARELPELMRLYGQDKIVLIVADSDAHKNLQVMTQAFLCRGELMRLGAAEAYVMVPKEVFGPGVKAGLDDSVGAGSCLEECIILHREPGQLNDIYTTMFSAFTDFAGTRSEARNGAALLVQSMGWFCDPETGLYKASQRAQARQVGWAHRARVGRRLKDLQEWGFVETVAGSLEVGQGDYSYEETYKHTPTLRLHETLRPKAWRQSLSEFFAERDNERNNMDTAVANELRAGQARIELQQTMHGETMDHIREMVEKMLEPEGLQDPRLDEAA